MKAEYFLVLLIALAVPFIKSFSKELSFYKYPLRLITALAIPFVIFIVWDIFAAERGHWSFNEKYISGLKIINLPVEEILFFLVIPFCALFTWEVVKYFMRKSP
jgi:lycopene cyclase domain-containing protein